MAGVDFIKRGLAGLEARGARYLGESLEEHAGVIS